MTTRNHLGKTLYVALALPATNNAAGFEALTWVKVNGYVSGPQFGFTHNAIDIPDMQTGVTTAVKGAGSGQDSQIAFRMVSADTGQGHMKTLGDGAQGLASIKVVTGSGTDNAPVSGDPVQYAQGYIHSYTLNEMTDTSYEGFTVGFRQNAPHVDATQPA